MGIPSQVGWDGEAWLVAVDEARAGEALAGIARYERENPRGRRVVPEFPSHPRAWTGSFLYAAVLLAVGYFAGQNALGVDWLQSCALSNEGMHAGEAWRAVTAQTLHLDVAHLLANLGFGTVFGLFAGQLLGPGVAWASVVAAAALANVLNAFLRPEASFSVGASTTGTVQGVVRANGAPQPGATVELTAGGLRATTLSDASGAYRVTGVPEGGVSVLPMDRATGDRLVTHDRFKLLTFTGSSIVGWGMKARASKKRVLLELGGNAGVVIDDTADVAFAAARVAVGGFALAGQNCISVQRVFVHASVFDRFAAALCSRVEALKVGNPLTRTPTSRDR